jgi:hypothetical protein
MRCVRSCGRKAQPRSKLCLVCEQRQNQRDYDNGRFKKKRRAREHDYEKG